MLSTDFLDGLRALESAYLATDDPLGQSGFSGGAERWRSEREFILEAVSHGGTFLDIGCANGVLLECLVGWAQKRGLDLVPFGLDCSPALVALARQRFPRIPEHFFRDNAWQWVPPRRFDYVYTLADCVPANFLRQYLLDLLANAVHPGGTLIIGSYGSRSRNIQACDLAGVLDALGFPVAASASSSDPYLSKIAWIHQKPAPENSH